MSDVKIIGWAKYQAIMEERDMLRAQVERLQAGGCARDQKTTQWCAEAVALAQERDRLKAELDATKEAVEFFENHKKTPKPKTQTPKINDN